MTRYVKMKSSGERVVSVEHHFVECRRKWVQAIHEAVGPTPPQTSVWRGPSAIAEAIRPFLATTNHLHFATGGGHDLADVRLGHEPGTLEFVVSEKVVYLGRPSSMTLEYIAAEPAESFLMIELDPLAPSGVYEADRVARDEEIVELAPRQYVERAVWDHGYIGHDGDGCETPLPASARRVHRMFDGRLMLVTKGSIWNGIPATYNGMHDQMSNDEIRRNLERVVTAGEDD
ncbi:MAG: hypothetical protein PGN16_08585 [Sphingomonas phyllosphaerae]|uniref:hypothetical protein n=1 Tax=Sphingomonas phyllosphaerae TaxID=257003 RepID=UPI002FF4502D